MTQDLHRPLKILIVDDSHVDRLAISLLITHSDLDASVLETDGARSLFASGLWAESDCILLDYNLEDGDGLSVLDHLKARAGFDMPPVVMLTGAGNEWVAAETIKRGGHDYLVKDGVTATALERAIGNAIEKQNLAMQLASKTREMERLSLYDGLTGLPNRNLYHDRLMQLVKASQRTENRFALFVMDLDGFKEINDRLGHHVGDKLLEVVGERLARAMRRSDTVARLGGDEFAAILPTTGGLQGALVMAEKIEALVKEPVLLEEGRVEIGISIGIVFFPDHGIDPESLFRNADAAMYAAKRGRRGHVVYEGQFEDSGPNAALAPGRISRAIERGELTLCYQPKVALETGDFAGLEALVRWKHPELGLLSPRQFIPQAERMALITPMTFEILQRALGQMCKWRGAGLDTPVAVNISARLLENDGLAESIDRCLRRCHVPPTALTLEISETAVMANTERALQQIAAIQSRGVRISIDDFGTGHTSLKQLMDLPIAELKVDNLFTDGVTEGSPEAAIISSIVTIARGLGISVVAEGVETAEAWDRLLSLGCHFGQGFLIARPMPPGEIEPWIMDWQSSRGDGKAQTASAAI